MSKQLPVPHYFIGEPFNLSKAAEPVTDPRAYHLYMLKQMLDSNSVVTKSHIDHIDYMHREFPDIFAVYHDVIDHTIVLYRKNTFATALSHAIAEITGEWQFYSFRGSLEITWEQFAPCLYSAVQFLHQIAVNAGSFRYDEIVAYEDLSYDPETDYKRTMVHRKCGFKPMGELISLPAASKRQIVTNYDELREQALDYLKYQNSDLLEFQDGVLVKMLYRNVL
jgi:hypothetical protein